jgi:hypothetical protein
MVRQSAPLLQCRFDKTLVGYENGLIVVINEADGAMLKVVDIINKQPANRKNHFMEFDGIVYVSCDFVQFNLKSMLLVILISSEMLVQK